MAIAVAGVLILFAVAGVGALVMAGTTERAGGPPQQLAAPVSVVSEPRFAGPRVVAPATDSVIGFDTTGERRWQTPCRGASWASPMVTASSAVAVVLCDGRYTAIRGDDGVILWIVAPPADVDRTRTSGVALTAAGSHSFTAWDMTTGTVLMTNTDLGSVNAAADEAEIYASNDEGVHAFDRTDGVERWKVPEGCSGLYAANGSVFARTNSHALKRIEVNTGRVIWRAAEITTRLDNSDVVGVTDNAVVVWTTHGGSFVTVYDRETGAVLWQRDDPKGGLVPAVGPGDVIALTDYASAKVIAVDDRTGTELGSYDNLAGQRASIANGRMAFIQVRDGERQLRVVAVR